MINTALQATYRARLFRHLDGIVVAPSAYALYSKGITKRILNEKSVSVSELSQATNANEGYLNVALRLLASQGWLEQEVDNINNVITYSANDKTATAFELFPLYEDVTNLLKLSEDYHFRKFEVAPFKALQAIFDKYKDNYNLDFSKDKTTREIQEQVLAHIEGIILGPTLVHLAMNGAFHKYFMQASFRPEEFHNDAENFMKLLDMLVYFDLFSKRGETYQFTDKGLFFAKRASAYGVTVSYIPTLRKLDELIFGNPLSAKDQGDRSKEGHVDRAMNVWGSGGAHATYFKVVDKIILDIFNKPLEEQPKGILDMGCGNGAFLIHLYNLIERHTLRGKHLNEHPLILVGADYNKAAIDITKGNLIQSEIWAKVMWGDIGDPDRLAADLQEDYGIELSELLNVRSFLDHNRVWKAPVKPLEIPSSSTGAFAFEGKRLSNSDVEASLAEHFGKWSPYVSKHGLVLIELHSIPPIIAAKNIGKTAVTAYDATHGYSDQFIVEVPVFHNILENIGMKRDERLSAKFPNTEAATVTVNLFRN
ncbi:class I SAM-dependent methyltransferase [Dokdonia sinensis]|uniref:Class I SAM-dependent methyltransferase n=1 Tax=Dokdonia sinensis TaxID=2479847 RepID=A0A3M0FY30_9FLAO|nr:class I SAM-dependent methyltransferase [Dokdonia sinensis]RMB57601.1 class I SAM-dependent methyltransferase [Dokdonia sinensis]